jgi:hypothetical protein
MLETRPQRVDVLAPLPDITFYREMDQALAKLQARCHAINDKISQILGPKLN